MRNLNKTCGLGAWTLCTLAVMLAMLVLDGRAVGQTWIGGTSIDWNTASNWNPATVPNSASAAVIFGNTDFLDVNISSSVTAQSITFANSGGDYDIGSTAGQTLSGVSSITAAANVINLLDIDLASVASGSLLFTGNLTVTNYAPPTNGFFPLNFDPSTVIGTPGVGGLIFAGPGNTNFSSSFTSTVANVVAGGLTKIGPGYLSDSGDGTNLGGNLTLNGGELDLNYSVNGARKFGNSGLLLDGGQLAIIPNSGFITATTAMFTTVNAGQTDIRASGPGVTALVTNAISRNLAGTIDFTPQSSGSTSFVITTSTGNTNGLLGFGPAFATLNGGTTWAMASGGNIAAVTTYGTNAYSASVNTDVTTLSTAIGSGFTTNSLRFNIAGGPVVNLTGTNTFQGRVRFSG